jgi:hypothetical protein
MPVGFTYSYLGYNGDAEINGIARERAQVVRPGPCITGMIDCRDRSRHPLAGYIIQDGSIPEPFNAFVQIMFLFQNLGKKHSFPNPNLRLRLRRAIAALRSLIFGPYAQGGAIQRTATYLIMSHDSNEISMVLKDDKMLLRGQAEGRSKHYATMKATLDKMLSHSGAQMGFSYFYGTKAAPTVGL